MTTLQTSDNGAVEEPSYPPIDPLRLYFSEPYQLKDKITINQPTIQDIIDYGEAKFYAMLRIFIQNTTMCRVQLWDLGIDWNDISDWELFYTMVTSLTKDKTQVLFGELDFTLFKLYSKTVDNPKFDEDKPVDDKKNPKEIQQVFLYDPVNDIEIDEADYKQLAQYLRNMFGIFPKDEFISTKFFREDIIAEERAKLEREAKEAKHSQSTLLPLISSCINHAGFKYDIDGLRKLGIYAFMDSVQRLQIYESSTALLKGMYSGFIDTKGIDPSQFNFMREI